MFRGLFSWKLVNMNTEQNLTDNVEETLCELIILELKFSK